MDVDIISTKYVVDVGEAGRGRGGRVQKWGIVQHFLLSR